MSPQRIGTALLFFLVWLLPPPTNAQALSAEELADAVAVFKAAERGPYEAIRWYCPDGSIIPAQSRCTDPGGIQHAALNARAREIRDRNGVHLGQILAGSDPMAFLDRANGFSRARQYELERFLKLNDGGWVLARAQFYRGAVQAEDEEAWGREYLVSVLGDDTLLNRHFFWLRRQVRSIPHAEGVRLLDRVRARAKTVSDAFPAFLNLRIKIHGTPDASDLGAVRAFSAAQADRLPAAVRTELQALEEDLVVLYATPPSEIVRQAMAGIVSTSPVLPSVRAFTERLDAGDWAEAVQSGAEALVQLRDRTYAVPSGGARLLLMDLSLAVEDALFQVTSNWQPSGVREEVRLANALSMAAAGAGYLERWEWEELSPRIPTIGDTVTDADLRRSLEASRSAVEWGIGLATATYSEVIRLYQPFEPLAYGFVDDLLRSSVMLPLGGMVSRLADELARRTGSNTRIMGLAGGGGVRGLNPGFARGVLEVVSGDAEHVELLPERIYVMDRPPAEMKPVAGIATVSEGNPVSHVQLLARNLGIPNAVVTPEIVTLLRSYDGEEIFYAVSPGGSVLVKPATEMSVEERELVETKARADDRVRVPTTRLALDHRELTDLSQLRASDSGRLCGPKAANLGQLASMFPDHVAPGFIVPFGTFRAHMEQAMPGTDGTYWEYLRASFAQAEAGLAAGRSASNVETELLGRLATLRGAIESIPFLPGFRDQLDAAYQRTFGSTLGSAPTFIRSDTNMEDLADFSGAGLNLTVPNVVREEDVLQGIRRVWASPYLERSYSWRQKYLLNPEDVYPSILILQSVNVDRSGVMITTGIASGDPDDVTIAFSRGIGGAVDGQAAESWLMTPSEVRLLAPAREPTFRSLPTAGGISVEQTSYEERLLGPAELQILRTLAGDVKARLPEMPSMNSSGPWDVELGFQNGKMWLFQVRPFVENRSAESTTYLQNLDAQPKAQRRRMPNSR